MELGDVGSMEASASGSLRTRSHSRASSLWTVQDLLILVNVIAVVEGDCQNSLSTYQKWSMIAENCTALDVVRNSSQCRRKWETLLAEYKLVKQWEASSGEVSYWSLGLEKRKAAGIPEDLDKELYEAIDNFTRLQDQADTDPEDDPEAAEIDVLDAEKSGPKPKKVKRRSTLPKKITGERREPLLKEEFAKPVPFVEEMEQIPEDCKPKRLRHQSAPQEGLDGLVPVVEQMVQLPMDSKPKRSKHWSAPQKRNIEEMRQPMLKEAPEDTMPVLEPKRGRRQQTSKNVVSGKKKRQKPNPHVEQMEQNLAEKLKENTELIHAILSGNLTDTLDDKLVDQTDEHTLETKRVRCKADKLITSLLDLTNNLKQLCDIVEE